MVRLVIMVIALQLFSTNCGKKRYEKHWFGKVQKCRPRQTATKWEKMRTCICFYIFTYSTHTHVHTCGLWNIWTNASVWVCLHVSTHTHSHTRSHSKITILQPQWYYKLLNNVTQTAIARNLCKVKTRTATTKKKREKRNEKCWTTSKMNWNYLSSNMFNQGRWPDIERIDNGWMFEWMNGWLAGWLVAPIQFYLFAVGIFSRKQKISQWII